MKYAKDLTGLDFTYLKVIEYFKSDYDKWGNKVSFWKCKCVCGKELILPRYDLTQKRKQSCGCMRYRLVASKKKKHGEYKTRLYHIWIGMRRRCFAPKNKHYHNYGERGITVCDEWANDFVPFRDWALTHGYSDDLTIERIDVNGNYEPQNCCWIPRAEQPKNTRISKRYTYNGETKTLRDWGIALGGSPSLVKDRLKRGWDIEVAISTPPIRSNNGKTRETINS